MAVEDVVAFGSMNRTKRAPELDDEGGTLVFIAGSTEIGKFDDFESAVGSSLLSSASGTMSMAELGGSSPPLLVALLTVEPVLSSRIFSIDLSISLFTSCLILFNSDSVYRTGMGIVGLGAVSLW